MKNSFFRIFKLTVLLAAIFFVFIPGRASATQEYFNIACGHDYDAVGDDSCSGMTQVMDPGAIKDDAAKGCPSGTTFMKCLKKASACTPLQMGGAMCTSLTVCCAKTYKIESQDQANCTQEDVVECGASIPWPPKGGLFSYKCVDPGACAGTVVAGANCPQGISGKVCCQLAKCVKAPNAPTTATKPPSEYKLTNPLGVTDISVIIGRIIKTFLGIVGGIALMVFVYGGVMWMTARGDASQVKKGQEALTAAVIGLFIIIFSYTLAGNFVTFLTSEQTQIAQEENRGGAAPQTTAEAQQVQTIQSAQQQAAQQQAGQAGAAQAGQEAGVTTPPAGCDQLSGQAKLDCIGASGQSLYTTPGLQTGMPGGLKDCTGNPNCSQVGWINVCGEKVFDTGYGTYNNLGCRTPDACAAGSILSSNCQGLSKFFIGDPAMSALVSNNCTKIALGSFGNNCGTGSVCCRAK
ncbi:MAG: pilin [Patescibacteria group bacterium]|nr:pilin [Patescibacteria group bacterium]